MHARLSLTLKYPEKSCYFKGRCDLMWLRTVDFILVFLFLFLYGQQGISPSFGLKFGWNPVLTLRLLWFFFSFYLDSAALVGSFRWIREPTQPWGLLSKLCTRHSVCFNSFRMWRIYGSHVLSAGYLGGGGGDCCSSLLRKQMFEEPQTWGIRWEGVHRSF